jgi:hypothetical protein
LDETKRGNIYKRKTTEKEGGRKEAEREGKRRITEEKRCSEGIY